jgi:hypothetical protein
MDDHISRDWGRRTPPSEMVDVERSSCGHLICTVVRGEPYVEIDYYNGCLDELYTCHEAKRKRRLGSKCDMQPLVLRTSDIIMGDYPCEQKK